MERKHTHVHGKIQSRAIFDRFGHQVEDKKTSRTFDQDAYFQKNPEIASIMREIDFRIIHRMLRDSAMRAGIQHDRVNLIQKSDICFQGSDAGVYDPETNLISIQPDIIRHLADELGVDFKLLFSSILIHESVHASSRAECHGLEQIWEWDKPDNQPKQRRIGYHVNTDTYNEGVVSYATSYRSFNEGVTEKYTRALFEAYVFETAVVDSEQWEEFKNKAYMSERWGYTLEVRFINELIDRIASGAHLDRITVWNALVSGMYTGDGFDDPEWKHFFTENMYDDFFKDLRLARSTMQVQRIIDRLQHTSYKADESLTNVAGFNNDSVWQNILKWCRRIASAAK